MQKRINIRKGILLELGLIFGLIFIMGVQREGQESRWAMSGRLQRESEETKEKDFIKWVDFNVSLEAMDQAYAYDTATHEEKYPLNWIQLLAYAAAKTGGDFSSERTVEKLIRETAESLRAGEETIETLTQDMKYYDYYLEAYTAVLGGLVGEYEIETAGEGDGGEKQWEKRYGLKGFHPIAKNFPYSDYDDFGVSRSFGYKRQHLGHDMMGQVGTPVIAVESGYVEALGWNQYGGWRIGIRSFDEKRYYYYAHLRQNYPYALDLKEGSTVMAGDVIGYMGRTGYSKEENVNNIDEYHLHFGLQLIFDESQKEGNQEIWVDCYDLVRFLYKNRSEAAKVEGTKEWKRVYQMKE